MIVDKACFERGCACYDDRVDGPGVEVVKKEWVGLTDDEIIDVIHPLVMADMADEATDYEIARAIEAKLKEKNQ